MHTFDPLRNVWPWFQNGPWGIAGTGTGTGQLRMRHTGEHTAYDTLQIV